MLRLPECFVGRICHLSGKSGAEKMPSVCVLAGPAELSAENQWLKLQEHPDVLAAAPDDEILAELLATQVCGAVLLQVPNSC